MTIHQLFCLKCIKCKGSYVHYTQIDETIYLKKLSHFYIVTVVTGLDIKHSHVVVEYKSYLPGEKHFFYWDLNINYLL